MADNYVEQLLEQWGLQDLIPIFNDEGIDEEAFKLLDVQSIEAIIKKKGPQLKFKQKFNQFHIQKWVLHCTNSAPTNTVDGTESSVSTNTNALDNTNIVYTINQHDEHLDLNAQNPEQTIENNDETIYVMTEYTEPSFLEGVSQEPPNKKRNTSIFMAGSLENFLQASVEGRHILLNKKSGFLNNTFRNKLCHLIISHLLNISERCVFKYLINIFYT